MRPVFEGFLYTVVFIEPSSFSYMRVSKNEVCFLVFISTVNSRDW